MPKFNGTYSYRAGYHGVRKSSSASININSDFWTCANGHRNPNFELVDDRAKGGFVHREKVIVCKQCAAQQSMHPTSGSLPDLQAVSTPQPLATSQALPTPPTCG